MALAGRASRRPGGAPARRGGHPVLGCQWTDGWRSRCSAGAAGGHRGSDQQAGRSGVASGSADVAAGGDLAG